MSLNDRERRSSLLIESYQNLSHGRKNNFTDNLGRLLSENSATRTWIKDNKLDKDNGFDWDSELAYTLFFGIYAKRTKYFPIPQEMKQDMVKNLSLQTRSVRYAGFCLGICRKANKINVQRQAVGLYNTNGRNGNNRRYAEKVRQFETKGVVHKIRLD